MRVIFPLMNSKEETKNVYTDHITIWDMYQHQVFSERSYYFKHRVSKKLQREINRCSIEVNKKLQHLGKLGLYMGCN